MNNKKFGLVTNDLSENSKGIMFFPLKDSIRMNLERLLFTEIGSYPGYPGFGSRIPQFLFEPLDSGLAADILREVVYLIENYEPRIELQKIWVTLLEEKENTGVIISLKYKIIETNEIEVVDFTKLRKLL